MTPSSKMPHSDLAGSGLSKHHERIHSFAQYYALIYMVATLPEYLAPRPQINWTSHNQVVGVEEIEVRLRLGATNSRKNGS